MLIALHTVHANAFSSHKTELDQPVQNVSGWTGKFTWTTLEPIHILHRLPLGVYRQRWGGGQIISLVAVGKQNKYNKEKKKVKNNLPQVMYSYLDFIYKEDWQLCNTCIDYIY